MPRTVDSSTSAADFLPQRLTLRSLHEAADECRGCPLYRNATQTVFGRGPRTARAIFVGEQPGNEEDLEGEPFVGPAGRVFDDGLARAGIAREDVYVTNAVKHFKWEKRGKRRIHKKPNAREIAACRPWLDAEIEVVHPEVIVCLGATAAQALLGRDFRVSVDHGKVVRTSLAPRAVATTHPSSILRQLTSQDRRRAMDEFVADLHVVAELLNER